MEHRSVEGLILYTSEKPETPGAYRGIERFHFGFHTDGSVTLRARCEIELPSPKILRDVVYGFAPDGGLHDAFVRLTVGDVFMGSSFYVRDGDSVRMDAIGSATGRISQERLLDGRDSVLGAHPLVNDAYLCRVMDLTKGPHRRKLRIFCSSADHRGASPPAIAPVDIVCEYVGDVDLKVKAGQFRAHHFRFIDEGDSGLDGHQPDINMWTTADGDFIYLKGVVGGYFQTSYELVEYRKRDPGYPYI